MKRLCAACIFALSAAAHSALHSFGIPEFVTIPTQRKSTVCFCVTFIHFDRCRVDFSVLNQYFRRFSVSPSPKQPFIWPFSASPKTRSLRDNTHKNACISAQPRRPCTLRCTRRVALSHFITPSQNLLFRRCVLVVSVIVVIPSIKIARKRATLRNKSLPVEFLVRIPCINMGFGQQIPQPSTLKMRARNRIPFAVYNVATMMMMMAVFMRVQEESVHFHCHTM